MTTRTQTLTEFLLARIGEDEAVARAATPGAWLPVWHPEERLQLRDGSWQEPTIVEIDTDHPEHAGAGPVMNLDGTPGGLCVSDEDMRHFVRNSPARVLAECEAKRRIVELHPFIAAGTFQPEGCETCMVETGFREFREEPWPCGTLRELALPHADHPDYREEWRP